MYNGTLLFPVALIASIIVIATKLKICPSIYIVIYVFVPSKTSGGVLNNLSQKF